MKQKIFLPLIILLYISSTIKAQKSNNETYSFSMQQCIDFAAKNQVDIVNAQYDEGIAKGKVNEILGSGLPQVNGSVSLNDFLQIPTQLIPAEFFGGKAGTFIPIKFGTQFNTTADLTISQLLFDGTYLVGLQASHTYVELSQKNAARTKIETEALVMKAYYSVLVAEEKMNLIDANVERLKKLYDDTKAMNDNGMVEKIDLDRVSVAYNNLKVEKDKMVRFIALSYNLLKFQMGMDQKATLTLTDKLNSLELVNWDVKTDGFDYTKRIEYSLMETQLKLGTLDLKRYKMTYYPSLVAFADISENLYENKFDISGSQKWYETEIVGAKLTIPIFDAQQKHSRVVQAQFNIKKLENQQKNLENSLNLQLTSAKTTYDNSVANLKVQKDNITLAEYVYNVTKTKYENGVGSNLEVVTAQTSLKEAQDNYYGATLKSKANSYSKLFIVCFISIFCMTFNARATIGDSCSHPVVIVATESYSPADYAVGDSVIWFSFVADSTSDLVYLNLPINPPDYPTASLKSFYVYSGGCASLTLIAQDTTINLGVSSDSLLVNGLTIGSSYYIKVVKTTPSAPLTYFSLSVNKVPLVSPNHLHYRTTLSECGLNYVHGDVVITRRMRGIDQVVPDDCLDSLHTYMGDSLPAVINISGMPSCKQNWRKAYIWFTASLFSSADSIAAITITIQPPQGPPYIFTPVTVARDAPKCWQNPWGEKGTSTYFFDITSIFDSVTNANGIYTIDTVTGISNPSEELDGATLLMTWVNPNANYQGNLVLWDGDVTESGYDVDSVVNYVFTGSGFPLSPSCTPGKANAFIIASDLEPSCEFPMHQAYLNNCDTTIGHGTPFPSLFWNFDVQSTTITSNQNSLCMGVHHADSTGINTGDCFEWAVAGLYYQSTCGSCTSSFTISSSYTPVLCYGESNGTASVIITSGTGPFTYIWSPVGGTNATASGLSAGTYIITVSDSVCGLAIDTVIVTQPDTLQINGVYDNVICYGDSNGDAYAYPLGGTGPFTYLWSTGGTTQEITGLFAGNYSVTVTDVNGCTADTVITVYSPSPVTASPVITEACILGNGQIILNASGGLSPYTYNWSPSVSTTDTASNLVEGYYSVTIRDYLGCTYVLDSMFVPGPPQLTMGSLPDTCHMPPIHSGAAFVIVTDGTPPYSYLWLPSGQNGATATNLPTGNDTVIVTDQQGCTAIGYVTVGTGSHSCPQPTGYSVITDTIITGIETWITDTLIVNGNITIAPGGELTLEGTTLMMGSTNKIIVERGNPNGGILNIFASTITGWGECNWIGIDVHGYDTAAQNTKQGQLNMADGVIENATVAAYMGNRDSSQAQQHEWTGGIIITELGAIDWFTNNTMSITFPACYPRAPYTYTSSSFIGNAFFTSDRNLYDPCYSRPLWFISIDSTNGVTMYKDSFAIYQGIFDYSAPDSTYGIRLMDSHTPPLHDFHFENVNKAIDVSYAAANDTGLYIYNDTIFFSQIGIRITNGIGDTIRYNGIYYAPEYYYVGNDSGIVTNNTQHVFIRDNSLYSLSYGITVNNCDSVYNSRIWNNDVEACYGYGIGTGGNNGNADTTGLTVYCNSISNCDTGWRAYNDGSNFIISEQGRCIGSGSYPPGNSFGNFGNYDIYNDTSVTHFVIKYDVPSADNLTPYMPNLISYGTGGLSPACGSYDTTQNIHCGTVEAERIRKYQIKDSSFNASPWLGAIYPNPFNDFTNAPYYLPLNCSSAEMVIYDIMGNKMDVYPLTIKGIETTLKIGSKNYSSGVYTCMLIVDGAKKEWKKLLIIK